MPKLSRTFISGLTPPELGEKEYIDSELPGFLVRVRSSGAMTYCVRYRVAGGRRGRERRLTIGPVSKLSLGAARARAKEVFLEVRLGVDPAAKKAAIRKSPALNDVIDDFVAGPIKRNRRGELRKPQNVRFEQAMLDNHVRPMIGRLKVADISKRDIERLRDAIAEGRTSRDRKTKPRGVSRVRGGEGSATRTLRALSVVMSYAIEHGYVTANPVSRVRCKPDGKSQRFLSYDEVGRLWQALGTLETGYPTGCAVVRLLLLTGCRRGEIEALRWTELDLENRLLRLENTKTGAKVVYLAEPAVALLQALPRGAASSWVFPGASPNSHFQSTDNVLVKARAIAGIGHCRVHDLRHTYASLGLLAETPLEVIAGLLGHKERRTTERYAHLAAAPLREASARVAALIELTEGNS